MTAGSCIIAANQAGNANYAAATQVTQTIAIGLGTQAISFSLAALPVKAYLDPPFSIAIYAKSDPVSKLAVQFTTLTPSVCSISSTGDVTLLTAGKCTGEAKQSGDANYLPAPVVPTQSFDIAPAAQVIVFIPDPLPAKTWEDPDFAVNATGGGSQLDVLLTSTTVDVCDFKIDPVTAKKTNVITLKSVGKCSVDAVQTGNTNYKAASLPRSFEVKSKSQTIQFPALANKIFEDLPFPLIATGGASGSPVTFTATPSTVCKVSGDMLTIVGAGDCNVAADQAASKNYSAAPQVKQKFTVAKKTQLIAFAIPAQTFTSAPISISATGGKFGNPVLFSPLTPAICTLSSTTSPSTVSLLTADTCTIEANLAGNANYEAAGPERVSFGIGVASQSIIFNDISPKTVDEGSFPLSASGGASGNLVTFTAAPAAVCTVTGGTVTIVGGGQCTVTANQAGIAAKFSAAPAVSITVFISAAKQAITFGPLADKTFLDPTFTVNATGGKSGNPVTFTATPTTVCTVSGNTVTIVGAGTCTIEASQLGSAPKYAGATPVKQSFTVAKAAQTIAFADNLVAKTLGAPPVTLSATATSSLPVSFTSLNTATCEVAQNVVTIKVTGTCTLRASQPGDSNYEKAVEVERSFNVNSNSSIGLSKPLPPDLKAGNPITFEVTVQPQVGKGTPTGTVSFSENGVTIGTAPLVNGVATFTTSALAGGQHTITAEYSGDANNSKASVNIGVPVLISVTVIGGGGSNGSTSGGGGGGCAMNNPAGKSRLPVDPAFPILVLGALVYFVRRKYE